MLDCSIGFFLCIVAVHVHIKFFEGEGKSQSDITC